MKPPHFFHFFAKMRYLLALLTFRIKNKETKSESLSGADGRPNVERDKGKMDVISIIDASELEEHGLDMATRNMEVITPQNILMRRHSLPEEMFLPKW
jgi:hypothetical protein